MGGSMIRNAFRLAAVVAGTWLVWSALSLQPSLAQAPGGETVALVNARVIDGTGAAPVERAVATIDETDAVEVFS